MASNQARRDGTNTIKTSCFFAALRKLQPDSLATLFALFPEGALPEPLEIQLPIQNSILEENLTLSECVEDSLRHLTAKVGPDRKLESAEVFVDIARHGTGKSVARLRKYGVTPSVVDGFVQQLGWSMVER